MGARRERGCHAHDERQPNADAVAASACDTLAESVQRHASCVECWSIEDVSSPRNLRRIFIVSTVFAPRPRRHGRQIAFIGMSLTMPRPRGEAAPESTPAGSANLVPADEIDNCDPSKLLIVTTGSQGEDRAQLALAANGSSRLLTLQPEDLLLYSTAKMIPGNEKRVMRMMNEIAKRGPEIAMGREDCLHSSGHGYKEELDEVIKLLKPEHFLPAAGVADFDSDGDEQLARQSGVQHTTVIGNGGNARNHASEEEKVTRHDG